MPCKSEYRGRVRGSKRYDREFDALNRDDRPCLVLGGEEFYAIPENDPRVQEPEEIPDQVEVLVAQQLAEAFGYDGEGA